MLVMLRSFLFSLCFFLMTSAMMLLLTGPMLLLPRSAMVPMLRLYARMVIGLLRLCCNIRLRVTGREYLPTHGAALIAAKHQSAFDTVVWLHLLPDACYVLKSELLKVPLWGVLARKSKMIAVDRQAGGRAMRQMLAEAKAAGAEGRQVVIFPEGTRVMPGRKVPYQPGVIGLAAVMRVPVIPVATDSGRCWPRHGFRKPPGIITVALLPPLPAGLPREALLPALEAAIEAETDLLCGVQNPVDKLVD
jgi:1-acyl-sn-glycerol-3-phosphate acyltransferase